MHRLTMAAAKHSIFLTHAAYLVLVHPNNDLI